MTAKKSVTIRGVEYPSVAEAARQLGVDGSTLRRALRQGRGDNVGCGQPGHRVQPGERIANKPIVIRDVEYPS